MYDKKSMNFHLSNPILYKWHNELLIFIFLALEIFFNFD